jgi:hypothetical protein
MLAHRHRREMEFFRQGIGGNRAFALQKREHREAARAKLGLRFLHGDYLKN